MAACGKPDSPRFSYVELTLTQRLTLHGSFEVTQRLASRVARRDTKVKIIIRKMFKFIFPIKAERK
ncbi:hypothetical protein [Leptospira noguchii]|uniref:Uncharacterized protein n=1 Tax=Leptospira noguchii TaxID=28182 RepID=A0AAE9K8K5_9LEPT|nr:hypothetical protein [Leptospira noguchii]UOG53279.1 hypothetical protein MAL09_03575 [Leptospira noguchii]UOG57240.1 hypothetical protein MAL03_03405 [Leptospira noguchii]